MEGLSIKEVNNRNHTLMFHPSPEGYAQIARMILQALEERDLNEYVADTNIRVDLGRISKVDNVYVNGKKINKNDYSLKNHYLVVEYDDEYAINLTVEKYVDNEIQTTSYNLIYNDGYIVKKIYTSNHFLKQEEELGRAILRFHDDQVIPFHDEVIVPEVTEFLEKLGVDVEEVKKETENTFDEEEYHDAVEVEETEQTYEEGYNDANEFDDVVVIETPQENEDVKEFYDNVVVVEAKQAYEEVKKTIEDAYEDVKEYHDNVVVVETRQAYEEVSNYYNEIVLPEAQKTIDKIKGWFNK